MKLRILNSEWNKKCIGIGSFFLIKTTTQDYSRRKECFKFREKAIHYYWSELHEKEVRNEISIPVPNPLWGHNARCKPVAPSNPIPAASTLCSTRWKLWFGVVALEKVTRILILEVLICVNWWDILRPVASAQPLLLSRVTLKHLSETFVCSGSNFDWMGPIYPRFSWSETSD